MSQGPGDGEKEWMPLINTQTYFIAINENAQDVRKDDVVRGGGTEKKSAGEGVSTTQHRGVQRRRRQ